MFIRSVVLATAALALQATVAVAGQCPLDMKKIDAALAAGPQLSTAQMAEVKELRQQGQEQHENGQHRQSVETLKKAKDILGVQ